MDGKSFKITLSSAIIPSVELKRRCESVATWEEVSIELELHESRPNKRGVDPTILVAVVSFTGTALGALISGLLQIANASRQSKIILQGKNGTRLEVPANTPPDKIDELIDKLRMIETEHIHLAH
jgi:hypothetical protein